MLCLSFCFKMSVFVLVYMFYYDYDYIKFDKSLLNRHRFFAAMVSVFACLF